MMKKFKEYMTNNNLSPVKIERFAIEDNKNINYLFGNKYLTFWLNGINYIAYIFINTDVKSKFL